MLISSCCHNPNTLCLLLDSIRNENDERNDNFELILYLYDFLWYVFAAQHDNCNRPNEMCLSMFHSILHGFYFGEPHKMLHKPCELTVFGCDKTKRALYSNIMWTERLNDLENYTRQECLMRRWLHEKCAPIMEREHSAWNSQTK